jgi:enhancing lycopene biosynthesis protein 2
MKIGVLLAGSGVYDGSEIHEAVFTLFAIAENNAEYVVFAPNKKQHHVVNHIDGSEMDEERNVLIEAARIARGDIKDLATITTNDFDALVVPGGFGAAKNLNQWALKGPDGEIDDAVKKIIVETVKASKPLAGLCMGPTVIAQALHNSGVKAILTVGTTEEKSPYEIDGIGAGMESLGSQIEMKTKSEICIDTENKIVTAPCYMMDTNIVDVKNNIDTTIKALVNLI